MSDDHKWVVVGKFLNKKVEIFKFNGQKYAQSQILNLEEEVEYISITKDDFLFLQGRKGLYVYKPNSNDRLYKLQRIQSSEETRLSYYEKYLTLSNLRTNKIHRYIFDVKKK